MLYRFLKLACILIVQPSRAFHVYNTCPKIIVHAVGAAVGGFLLQVGLSYTDEFERQTPNRVLLSPCAVPSLPSPPFPAEAALASETLVASSEADTDNGEEAKGLGQKYGGHKLQGFEIVGETEEESVRGMDNVWDEQGRPKGIYLDAGTQTASAVVAGGAFCQSAGSGIPVAAFDHELVLLYSGI